MHKQASRQKIECFIKNKTKQTKKGEEDGFKITNLDGYVFHSHLFQQRDCILSPTLCDIASNSSPSNPFSLIHSGLGND